MRARILDDSLKFRASSGLVAKLREDAERQGMSVSEYLRHTVRERISSAGDEKRASAHDAAA